MSSFSYNFEPQINAARNGFSSGKTQNLEFRIKQLKGLLRMVEENINEFHAAVYRDLCKNKWEANFYELDLLINVITNMIKDLKDHAQPHKLPFNLVAASEEAFIERIPYGVVLILGTWNLPVVMPLYPFVAALAAGNAIILKPSEISYHTSSLLEKLMPQYLDSDCYHVVQTDATGAQELLKNKFDYIYLVGSKAVGKNVLRAAAEHLTPVTLELGGKSPCYIDESADIQLAAKRILSCKLINLGQVCVAPDYIICSQKTQTEFVRAAYFVIRDWFGGHTNLQGNPALARIINSRHCLRLKNLLEGTQGKIAMGGKVDVNDLWVEPTIVVDVPMDDVLMEDEIFGPILPIVTVPYLERAMEIINSRSKPLSLYVFSTNYKISERILAACPSGTACINDCSWQCAWPGLPFGGIGASGMGKTGAGKIGYDVFSHQRSVLKRPLTKFHEYTQEFRYPPLSKIKTRVASFGFANFTRFNLELKLLRKNLISFILGMIALALFQYYSNAQ